MIKKFQNSSRITWTNHAQQKMIFYRLSEERIKRVLYHPDRVEEGIAPETVAAMQKAGSRDHPYEIWIMYQKIHSVGPKKKEFAIDTSKIRMISAWRYPGQSSEGKKIAIPDDVYQDLISLGIIQKNA